MKVALVHDYLREYGGAERVLEKLHKMFPEAPVYVAFVDKQALGKHWTRFSSWDIRETWATKIPFIKKLFSPLRVFASNFFRSLDLFAYDVVISSSNMYMAKAVRMRPDAMHLCYCHTPPRSLYGYTTKSNWKEKKWMHVLGEIANHFLRIVDYYSAQNPTVMIANSQEVQKRIQKFYRRDSVVIYPPISSLDVDQKREDYYLFVGRVVYSKHPNLVIDACTQLRVKLKVVGIGESVEELKARAGKTVSFLGAVSDLELAKLYAGARAVIYPAEDEDFGMIPIEAMMYGTPAIVHRSGGFLETVVEGENGLFVDDFKTQSMIDAIQESQNIQWDHEKIKKMAQKYSEERFEREIRDIIQQSP
ncbi:MAG: hypothetical protein A2378_04080 [Candidatus Pacebacteria bacterium RIFOXYB1_FULL_44_10]|nr:MAG: hypothetical protein A2378_04080 [Candidatus Pacebacteria bacterium RIFOXYB1_FULL_44_10]